MIEKNPTRQVFAGAGVGRGAAIGPVIRVPSAAHPLSEGESEQVPVQSVQDAFVSVIRLLEVRAAEAHDATVREVLEATASIASDPELQRAVLAQMESGHNAVAAVNHAVSEFADAFTHAGGYLAERVTDLHSVRDKLIAEILGLSAQESFHLEQPSVLVAEDLAPVDTAGLDLSMVLAIVLERGGPTGHTAIIATQHGIPCVMRVTGAKELHSGDIVAVNAAESTVIFAPTSEDRTRIEAYNAALQSIVTNGVGATRDGHPVQLLSNIGTPEDAESLNRNECEGVGLFRTELPFLGREVAPSITEQRELYSRVLRAFTPQKVVVRTLDAGADKPLPFLRADREENPALGIRGYRLTRRTTTLLDAQLRSLSAAATATNSEPWVMAPMITTAVEAGDFVRLARAAGFKNAGVMIEVPAAALRIGDILREVDFVSIGTNDLAQYTMASDRLVGELADLLSPWQPALLGLISHVLAESKRFGKQAGICGESAADPVMALVLTGLGASSLSMSISALPAVRYALSQHTLKECQGIATAAMSADTAERAYTRARDLVHPEVKTKLSIRD